MGDLLFLRSTDISSKSSEVREGDEEAEIVDLTVYRKTGRITAPRIDKFPDLITEVPGFKETIPRPILGLVVDLMVDYPDFHDYSGLTDPDPGYDGSTAVEGKSIPVHPPANLTLIKGGLSQN